MVRIRMEFKCKYGCIKNTEGSKGLDTTVIESCNSSIGFDINDKSMELKKTTVRRHSICFHV